MCSQLLEDYGTGHEYYRWHFVYIGMAEMISTVLSLTLILLHILIPTKICPNEVFKIIQIMEM